MNNSSDKTGPLHILLVDDDHLSLGTMSMILEMEGFQVSTASGGKLALECLRNSKGKSHVDGMVVDLEMPYFSGLDLLGELDKRGLSIPVVMVTDFASKKNQAEFKRRGVVEWMEKPIRMNEFRFCIHRFAQAIAAAPRSGNSRTKPKESL